MAKHILVTEASGAWPGLNSESQRVINSEDIVSMQRVVLDSKIINENSNQTAISTTVITLVGNKRIWVKETEQEVAAMIRKNETSFIGRLLGFWG